MPLEHLKPELLMQILETPLRAIILRAVSKTLRETVDKQLPVVTIMLNEAGAKEAKKASSENAEAAVDCPVITSLIDAMMKGLRIEYLFLTVQRQGTAVATNKLAQAMRSMPHPKQLNKLFLKFEARDCDLISAADGLKALAEMLDLKIDTCIYPADLDPSKYLPNVVGSLGALGIVQRMDLRGQLMVANPFTPNLLCNLASCTTLKSLSLNAAFNDNSSVSCCVAALRNLKALHCCTILMSMTCCTVDEMIFSLKDLPCLQQLEFRSVSVEASGIKAVSSILDTLPSLTSLKVATVDVQQEARYIAGGLIKCSNLRRLGLGHSQMGSWGMTTIAASLGALKQLESLDLTYNFLYSTGGTALAAGLVALSGLRRLELGRNELGQQGCTAVLEALQQAGATKLQHLDLSDNVMGESTAGPAAALLRPSEDMRELRLGGNKLAADGCAAVVKALGGLTRLSLLDLGCNDLGAAGATAAAAGLGALVGLKELVLCDNMIGPDGGAAVGEALRRLTGLTRLDLGGNGLDVRGSMAVAEAVAGLRRLEKLQLGYVGRDQRWRRDMQMMLTGVKSLSMKVKYA